MDIVRIGLDKKVWVVYQDRGIPPEVYMEKGVIKAVSFGGSPLSGNVNILLETGELTTRSLLWVTKNVFETQLGALNLFRETLSGLWLESKNEESTARLRQQRLYKMIKDADNQIKTEEQIVAESSDEE